MLATPLKHEYFSGAFDKIGSAEVAQLVVVPFAVKAVVNGAINTLSWDGHTGGIVAMRTLEELTVNSVVDASCTAIVQKNKLLFWSYIQ